MCPRCNGDVDLMSGICRKCGYDLTKSPDEQGRVRTALLLGLPVFAFVVWLSRDRPVAAAVTGVMYVMTVIRFVATGATRRNGSEGRERARIAAQMRGGLKRTKTGPSWLPLLMIPMVIVVCVLAVNPSLVTQILRGDGSQSDGANRPSATVTEYGRFRVPGSTRVVSDRNSSDGIRVDTDAAVVLVEQTDQIPCRVGETWGIRIRSSDVPTNRPYTIRQETYHPPIKRSDGSVRTETIGETKVSVGETPKQFYGWHFLKGHENELVMGEWIVVVFIDEVEVARWVFNIRK